MRIEFLGTGGAITTPRPGCGCRVCAEALERGVPYSRTGPSLFVHGPDLLIDTPEESKQQLLRAGIGRVAACLFSHWHPDHVMGRRVLETMNVDFRSWPPETKRTTTTDVYLPEQVAADFRARLGGWEHLTYLEERLGVAKLHVVADGEAIELDGLTVRPFRLAEDYVYAFLLEGGGRRALVAMDETYGWEPPAEARGCDLAIVPMGICEHHPLTGERLIHAEHPVLRAEATFADTRALLPQLEAGAVLLSHVEEPNGLSYDDLLEVERLLAADGTPATFAYDTLVVEL